MKEETTETAPNTDLLTAHPIDKFKIFGALDYTIDEIAVILDVSPMERNVIAERLDNPRDELAIAYSEGKFRGKAQTDVALTQLAWKGESDAIETLSELIKGRKIDKLKKELFGL